MIIYKCNKCGKEIKTEVFHAKIFDREYHFCGECSKFVKEMFFSLIAR